MRWLTYLFVIFAPLWLRAGEGPEMLMESLPKVLLEFERSQVQHYADANLGSSVDFKKPGLLVTVFAYDLGKKNIPPGIEEQTVQEAYQGAMDDVKEAVNAGFYGELQERDKGVAKCGALPVLRARYRLTRLKGMDKGQRCASEVYVFGARGMIIKLRLSSGLEREAENEKTMEKFLPAVSEALKKKHHTTEKGIKIDKKEAIPVTPEKSPEIGKPADPVELEATGRPETPKPAGPGETPTKPETP